MLVLCNVNELSQTLRPRLRFLTCAPVASGLERHREALDGALAVPGLEVDADGRLVGGDHLVGRRRRPPVASRGPLQHSAVTARTQPVGRCSRRWKVDDSVRYESWTFAGWSLALE